MLKMRLTHKESGVTGKVKAVTVHPDGSALARIKDKWFLVSELTKA